MPQEEQTQYNVIGGDFESIMVNEKQNLPSSTSVAVADDHLASMVDCGKKLGMQSIVTAPPRTVSIEKDNHHAIAENKQYGIYPDENVIYSFEMVSLFGIRVHTEDNMDVISDESTQCRWITAQDTHPALDPEYPTEPTHIDFKFKLVGD